MDVKNEIKLKIIIFVRRILLYPKKKFK